MTSPAGTSSKRRPRWRRWVRRALIAIVGVPLLLYGAFCAAVAWWPYPAGIAQLQRCGAWIEDRRGVPLAAMVAPDEQWRLPLSYEQFSPHLLKAMVAIEDSRFYEHAGVDWRGSAAAVWQNARSLRIVRGGSTLTMQLHRLRDPRPRSLWAKVEQAIRAQQIEKTTSKTDILVEYLNRGPFGGNLVGAGAASWRYFGRPCSQLSLAQAALLAGLPQNPNRLRPDRFPEKAKQRRDRVLERMLSLGYITAEQHAEALAEPINAGWHELPQMGGGANRAPTSQPAILADGAMPCLLEISSRSAAPVIRTTLDAGIQRQAFVAAKEQLAQLAESGIGAVAVVVLDTQTAEVLADVSICPADPNLDLARCTRSTGSALKPFIYAAAFEAGITTPDSIVRDSPAAWPGYMPANFDHRFRGSMKASEALADSRNIPALQLLSQVGVERACGLMGSMGLRTLAKAPHRYGLSLAIGGAEGSPLELAEAYATLGRGGRYQPATFLRQPRPTTQPVCIADWACWQTLRAITDSDRTARICPEAALAHVAWKTGTSSGFRDAWCAAVTAHRTIAVWMGNPAGRGTAALVGAEAAAPLALRLIGALERDPQPWPEPKSAGVTSRAVQAPARRQLTLLSPADGLEVVYNPEIPSASQRIQLKAMLTSGPGATSPEADKLWWFVDGRAVGSGSPEQAIWWPPTAGTHEVRVTDGQGRVARAKFVVR